MVGHGGEIVDISRLDRLRFEYLKSVELPAARSAQRVYAEMEWE